MASVTSMSCIGDVVLVGRRAYYAECLLGGGLRGDRVLLLTVADSQLNGVLKWSLCCAAAHAPLDLACASETLPSVADASAEVALPFSLDTGDAAPKTSVWVSENGLLAFDEDPGVWFPVFDLANLSAGNFDVIAPLYADASQGANSSVTYGTTTFEGLPAFCVNWTNLEPNNDVADIVIDPVPTNTFQVVIVERTDRNVGAFDIITNYASVGWDDSFCNDQLNEGFGLCCEKIPIEFDVDVEAAQVEGPCCGDIILPSAAAAQGPECCDIEFEGPCCDFQFEGPCCDIQFEGPCCEIEFGAPCCDIDGELVPCDDLLLAQADPVFPPDQTVAGVAGVSFPADGSEGFLVGRTVDFAGSGILEGMTDPNGLSATSLNSLQAGRHVVEVDGGFASPVGSVFGRVELEDGSPVADGLVWVCGGPDLDDEVPEFECAFTRTGANGGYELDGVPLGFYEVTARGPAGSDLFDQTECSNRSPIKLRRSCCSAQHCPLTTWASVQRTHGARAQACTTEMSSMSRSPGAPLEWPNGRFRVTPARARGQ